MKPEQFAGWGSWDHMAVCLVCRTKHLIPRSEQITSQPWLDWHAKHRGHPVRIVPYRLLHKLADRLAYLLAPYATYAHNADRKVAYVAGANYTITLASLASHATLLAGRESTSVSNTTNNYLDELVAGHMATGTTPTAGIIEVHVIGSRTDVPAWPDVFDGTDSAETVGSAEAKAALSNPIALIATNTTSDHFYNVKPTGIRRLFGDAMPTAHILFVTHNTVAALNATGSNHELNHIGVYETIS